MKPAEPSPPRLLRFAIRHDAGLGIGPNIRNSSVVAVDNPPNDFVGWTIQFRGAAVFLVSPPGWEHGGSRRKDDEVTIVGPIPREAVTCMWRGADAAATDRMARFDIELKRVASSVDAAVAIDPKEMGDA